MADTIDHSVGLEMLVRVGDRVEGSQLLVKVFAVSEQFERVREMVAGAITLSDEAVAPLELIVERIE